MTAERSHYPVGGAALGWLVKALRIRELTAKKAGVDAKTLDRFFNGAVVSEANLRAIFEAVARRLFPPEVVRSLGLEGDSARDFDREVAASLSCYVAAWSQTAGRINSTAARSADAAHRLLPWVRFLLIDLAVRFGAFLKMRCAEPPSDEVVEELSLGNAFALVLRRLLEDEEPRITHEQLSGDEIAKNQPSAWVTGAGLPRPESLVAAARVIASKRGRPDALVEFELRMATAGSALVRELANLIGKERAAAFIAGFMSLVEFVVTFVSASRKPPGDLEASLRDLIANGARASGALFILRGASRIAGSQNDQEDLVAATGDWGPRLELWSRMFADTEGAVRTVVTESGMTPESARELLDAAAYGLLTLKPLGRAHPDGPIIRITGDNRFKANNREVQYSAAKARGDLGEAEVHLRRMIELAPDNPKYRFWLGADLRQQRRWDEALVELQAATELKHDWELPRIEVGLLELDQGKTEAGLATMEAIAESSPPSAHLSYSIGVALMRLARFAPAVRRFEEAVAINAEHALALDCLAHCLFAIGDHKNGLRRAKEAAARGQPETLAAFKSGRYPKRG